MRISLILLLLVVGCGYQKDEYPPDNKKRTLQLIHKNKVIATFEDVVRYHYFFHREEIYTIFYVVEGENQTLTIENFDGKFKWIESPQKNDK